MSEDYRIFQMITGYATAYNYYHNYRLPRARKQSAKRNYLHRSKTALKCIDRLMNLMHDVYTLVMSNLYIGELTNSSDYGYNCKHYVHHLNLLCIRLDKKHDAEEKANIERIERAYHAYMRARHNYITLTTTTPEQWSAKCDRAINVLKVIKNLTENVSAKEGC